MHEEYMKYLKLYKSGEFLVTEDDCDDDFYCLLSGKVGIWKGDPKKPNELIEIREISDKGSYFGEMSVLLKEDRSASVIAKTDAKVFKLPGKILSQVILEQPNFALRLCTSLADLLRKATIARQDLTQQRNEIRDDATAQLLHAKENFQKIFIMLSAIEYQLRNPLTKSLVEHMSQDKLLKGGRRIHLDKECLEEMPDQIADLVVKVYSDILS